MLRKLGAASRCRNGYFSQDKKGSTYPGIDYFIKPTSKPNVDIWLRVEVDCNLYVGFCVVESNKWNGSLLSLAKAKKALPGLDVAVNNKGWWLYWEYLLNNGKKETPNFKEYNDIYISHVMKKNSKAL